MCRAVSHKNVPNDPSQCRTKRIPSFDMTPVFRGYILSCQLSQVLKSRCRPSFGMTPTQANRDLFCVMQPYDVYE